MDRDRLIEVINAEDYGKPKDCICPGCVCFYSKADLFVPLNEVQQKMADKEVRQAIEILRNLRTESIIDSDIEPFKVTLAIFENIINSTNVSLKILRDNAILLGYIHSYIQYLWYAENIRSKHPDFKEERINRIMFNTEAVKDIEPLEIGIAVSRNKGYVVFVPMLLPNGSVQMEYKFISNPKGFGIFNDLGERV